MPVSASRKLGLDVLQEEIVKRLPEGPAYFPEDYITDQPERFLAAELIREKILRETREEVPHSVAVEVDKWEDTPRLTTIFATVRVERPGQKGIVIGAKGSMLKKIGTEGARRDGASVRSQDPPGVACARAAGLAREAGLPQYPGLAYNDRESR